MKIIKVKDFSPTPGAEWSPSAYPGDGAYITPTIGLVLVAGGGVYQAGINALSLISQSASDEASGGVSGDVLLKAIAIAQDPNLAATLCK
jgi:hypothetical protein